MRKIFYLIALVIICSCSSKNKSEKLTVFVAASLTNVMNELVDSFKVYNKTEVNINYASSGTLARQIAQGANCNLYISANKKWMDYLQELGVLEDSSRYTPVSNQLVLIIPKGDKKAEFKLKELPQNFEGRLAIGDPNHVPAGVYAFEVLNNLGIYDDLTDRILPAKDVRGALMAVEMGECSYGMVYYTDALKSEKVDVSYSINDSLHSSIDYHASLIKNDIKADVAFEFYQYMKAENTRLIWEKNGFVIKE